MTEAKRLREQRVVSLDVLKDAAIAVNLGKVELRYATVALRYISPIEYEARKMLLKD